jgi:hypothetical protein
MFGFSLPKLLFTALIIGAALYGFKYLSRGGEKNNKVDEVVGETVRCSVCGEFVVVEGAQDCGKPGCPNGSL